MSNTSPKFPTTHPIDNNNNNTDVDAPSFLSPHRRLNWMVYLLIYMVMIVILSYSYSSSQSTLPLYRQQLQNPTKLIQLTLEDKRTFPKKHRYFFQNEASVPVLLVVLVMPSPSNVERTSNFSRKWDIFFVEEKCETHKHSGVT